MSTDDPRPTPDHGTPGHAAPLEPAETTAVLPDPAALSPETTDVLPEVEPGYARERPGATAVQPFDPDGQAPRRRGPRMRTLVLGLVLAAVSVTSLVRLLTDVRVDDGAVALAVLIAAGLLLVGGGIAAATRDARDAARRT